MDFLWLLPRALSQAQAFVSSVPGLELTCCSTSTLAPADLPSWFAREQLALFCHLSALFDSDLVVPQTVPVWLGDADHVEQSSGQGVTLSAGSCVDTRRLEGSQDSLTTPPITLGRPPDACLLVNFHHPQQYPEGVSPDRNVTV